MRKTWLWTVGFRCSFRNLSRPMEQLSTPWPGGSPCSRIRHWTSHAVKLLPPGAFRITNSSYSRVVKRNRTLAARILIWFEIAWWTSTNLTVKSKIRCLTSRWHLNSDRSICTKISRIVNNKNTPIQYPTLWAARNSILTKIMILNKSMSSQISRTLIN